MGNQSLILNLDAVKNTTNREKRNAKTRFQIGRVNELLKNPDLPGLRLIYTAVLVRQIT